MPIKHVSIEAEQVDGYTIQATAGSHTVFIDQPVKGGGGDNGPTPLEYLFLSLGGCVITIGYIIARQRRLPVRMISVKVEAELDTDVLSGKATGPRPGFQWIRVITDIDADMTQEEKEQFIRDVDARCPISDNIFNTTPVEIVVSQPEAVA